MKDYSTTFEINQGQTTRLLVRLNPRPSRASAWVSLAFSSLLFAGAGVVGWYSTTIYDDLERAAAQGRLASDDPRIERGFIWALSADLGFLVGTVTAALSLYYFLRDPLPPSEGRTEPPVDFTENPEAYRIGSSPTPSGPTSAPRSNEAATPPTPSPTVTPPPSAPRPPAAPAPIDESAPITPTPITPTPITPTSSSDEHQEGLTGEEAEWLFADDSGQGRESRRSRRPSVFAGGGPFPSLMIRF